MSYTTDELVAALKRDFMVPTGQTTFNDPTDFLAIMTDQLLLTMVPKIMSVRQDFFRTRSYVSLVDQVNHYALPERAIGTSLKDIHYIPDVNDKTNKRALPKISARDEVIYGGSAPSPIAHDFEGDEVIVYPKPSNPSGQIEFVYFQRPSKLVSVSSCSKLTAAPSSAAGTTTFTVDTDLTASLSVGDLVDVLSGKNPYRLRYTDVPITAITATTISVSTASVQDESSTVTVAKGDYICPAQQSCIPNLPLEFHPILVELTGRIVMKGLGAQANTQLAKLTADEMIANALTLIANRVDAEPDILFDRDGVVNSLMGVNVNFTNRPI